jgi:hypothetical protein
VDIRCSELIATISAGGSVDTGNLADSQAVVSNRLAMALVMSVSFRQKPSLDGEAGSHVWWLAQHAHGRCTRSENPGVETLSPP